MPSATPRPSLPVAVNKPTPYLFDLGLLCASDINPLPIPASSTGAESLESFLAATARDGAQALINQLLTVCAPQATTSGVTLALPAPHTPLPREKPVPEAKPLTKWQEFAKRKGIQGKTRLSHRNVKLGEESGQFEKRWGKDGLNKKDETAWLVEVDNKKLRARAEKLGAGAVSSGGHSAKKGKALVDRLEAQTGEIDPRALARAERKERVKRNDRRMRKNEWRADQAKKLKAA